MRDSLVHVYMWWDAHVRLLAVKIPLPVVMLGILSVAPGLLLAAAPPDFLYHVVPTLTRAGCNAGVCHGTPSGKNGFRLSLRGFDPRQDFVALTREVDGRRINRLVPSRSLILQKATAEIPHQGGRRLRKGDTGYRILHDWIAAGAVENRSGRRRLKRLAIEPAASIVDAPGDHQTLRVIAHFDSGRPDDVTDRCRFSVTDAEVAELGTFGTVRKLKRGEVTVSAEYVGAMASATVLFREPVAEFSWPNPPTVHPIDARVFARLKSLQIEPSGLCDDATFVRRVYLDANGRLPTAVETRAFLANPATDKRRDLIDRLLNHSEFARWWAMKWTDRLGCNQRFVGKWGAVKFHSWIRHQMAVNTPHDDFVREILVASGPNYSNPPAGFWRRLRVGGISKMDPLLAAEEISQLFLGVRIQCARCHNHPGEHWTQDDYYGLAAFFPRLAFKEGPYVNHRYDKEDTVYAILSGEVTHPRSGTVSTPRFLGGVTPKIASGVDRRVAFADWATAAENPFFARAAVNRIWYQLLGRGIVEPVDDFRSSNPPSQPQLLEWLTREFVSSGFDRKHIIRLVLNSHTYQLGFQPTATADARYFSYYRPRLLQAEQLLDAISQASGVPEPFSGFPSGTRAIQLPDGERKHPFLEAFGRPARALACECERESTTTMAQALQLVGGKLVHQKLVHEQGLVAQLAASSLSPSRIVEELFLVTLCRPPSSAEQALLSSQLKVDVERRKLVVEDILWNLLNHREFLFQH